MKRSIPGSPRAPLFAAAFVLAVDAAGAGHLFPALERATNAPPRGGSWFLTITMLGALVGAPLLARAAGRHGRMRVLTIAMWAFAAASVVVGLSSSYPLTLLARFVQGVAGSPVLPLAAAHLAATSAEGGKGRSVSLLSLFYAGGFVAGIAFVSLFLLLSFRAAYLFTAALAAMAALGIGTVPDRRRGMATPPAPEITVASVLAWCAALSLVAFAVNHAVLRDDELARMPSAYRLAVRFAQVAAVPALVAFVIRDGQRVPSLLPRALFRSRLGLATTALSIAAGLGQASVVVLPACAMIGLGVSAAATGPMLLPVVVGGVGANVLVSARLDRWGPRPFLAAGVALLAAGDVVVATTGTTLAGFELGALLVGTGVSLLSSGALRYLATLFGAPEDADARQAAVSLLTNIGVLLGGALWGAAAGASTSAASAVQAGLASLTVVVIVLASGLVLLSRSTGQRR